MSHREQSKKASLIESVVNITAGFMVSFGLNFLVLPVFGFHVNVGESLLITVAFTVVSFVRYYCFRRFFNFLHKKQILK